MADTSQVHWYEGLFLKPHHLQFMQQRILERIVSLQRLTRPYPFGLIKADYSADALKNGYLRFSELRLITPEGVEIDVPGNTILDDREFVRSFPVGGAPLLVSIALPNWSLGRANTIDNGEVDLGTAKRRYRVAELELADENTGGNPQPVRVRKLNARLLLGDEDSGGMDVLPLFRIKNPATVPGSLPEIDETYFPPCLTINAWNPLRKVAAGIIEYVEAKRKLLAAEMKRDRFDLADFQPAQMKSFARLQALLRCGPKLAELITTPDVTPFEIFMELRQLLAELSSTRGLDEVDQIRGFDPYNLAVLFLRLDELIRTIPDDDPSNIKEIELVPKAWWFEALQIDPQLLSQSEFYIGIQAGSMHRDQLIDIVHKRNLVKLLPPTWRGGARPGAALVYQHSPPPKLQQGFAYFEVSRAAQYDQDLWQQIRDKGQLILEWRNVGEEIQNVKANLVVVMRKRASDGNS